MKKWILAMVTTSLVLVAGIGGALASDLPKDPSSWTFEDMLPFMKKMHPNMDEKALKGMFDSCHKNGGMMNSSMMKDL